MTSFRTRRLAERMRQVSGLAEAAELRNRLETLVEAVREERPLVAGGSARVTELERLVADALAAALEPPTSHGAHGAAPGGPDRG